MIVSLSFFRYRGLVRKTWAFLMMQFAHRHLREVPGLRFYRLLGTGAGNGFRPDPDFSVYAFLGVWDEASQADHFIKHSRLFGLYRKHAGEVWTVFLKTLRAHGRWSGQEPFVPEQPVPPGEMIAVITRARIARNRLLRFWKKVPAASAPLAWQEGLVLAFGIGEWPVTRMATFSIWKDEAALQAYAYGRPEHLEAIRLTRELNWYSEELFARFRPVRSEGSWEGKDPLAGLL